MHLAAFWAVLLLPLLAAAQPTDPVQAGIILSLDLQKRAVQAQDLAATLAAAKNRIAELEKLCGEPCKPAAEAK